MKSVLLALALFANQLAMAQETLNANQARGKSLYDATCIYCHNPKGWATERLKLRLPESQATLAERRDLDRGYIRHVVRNGLVNMPAFTPTDLTEAQIQLLIDYLTRNNAAK